MANYCSDHPSTRGCLFSGGAQEGKTVTWQRSSVFLFSGTLNGSIKYLPEMDSSALFHYMRNAWKVLSKCSGSYVADHPLSLSIRNFSYFWDIIKSGTKTEQTVENHVLSLYCINKEHSCVACLCEFSSCCGTGVKDHPSKMEKPYYSIRIQGIFCIQVKIP